MKKDLLLFAAFIFGVATTAGAAKSKAGERIDTLKARQLQEVQVISTRASKKAPLAFTNVSKNDIQAVNYGKDIPYLLALTPLSLLPRMQVTESAIPRFEYVAQTQAA